MRYICIGRIVNTHGLKGEVRLISKFKFKDKVFKEGMNIYIGNDKIKEVINSYRPHKNFDMITIKGIININDVLKYKGLKVFIDYQELVLNSNEYLDEDLIGLRLYMADIYRGVITKIEVYDNYKFIVVNNDEKEYLIPYVSDIIESINFKEGNIYINDIKGLFDI